MKGRTRKHWTVWPEATYTLALDSCDLGDTLDSVIGPEPARASYRSARNLYPLPTRHRGFRREDVQALLGVES